MEKHAGLFYQTGIVGLIYRMISGQEKGPKWDHLTIIRADNCGSVASDVEKLAKSIT
jgi:hypothetical protein